MNIGSNMLQLNHRNVREESRRLTIMLSMFVIAMSGMAGLILYEIVQEVSGARHRLEDRYHE